MRNLLANRKVKSKNKSILFIILFSLLFIYSVSIILPLLWAILQTFRTSRSYSLDGPLAVGSLTFRNLGLAFNGFLRTVQLENGSLYDVYVEEMFYNTIVYSLGSTFMYLVATCMVAYTISRFPYKFSKILYAFVILVMALPIVGSLPSEIDVSLKLGLYGKMWGVFIMKFNFLSGTYFLVLYETFRTIPNDYAEAAQIDGAGNFKIFLKIMLPMVRNVLGTIAVIYFVQFWNDYQTPLIYLRTRPTIAYGLLMFQYAAGELATTPVQFTACLFLLLPVLAIYIAFRDKFLGNISMGGIKG